MYLYFDTLKEKKTIQLLGAKKEYQISFSSKGAKEHILLYLDKLQKKAHFNLSQIDGLIVNTGSGSFSSIRKILVITNILAWYLNIPLLEEGTVPSDRPLKTRLNKGDSSHFSNLG